MDLADVGFFILGISALVALLFLILALSASSGWCFLLLIPWAGLVLMFADSCL